MRRSRQLLSLFLSLFILGGLLFFPTGPVWAWSGRAGWVFKGDAPFSSGVAASDGLVLAGDNLGNLYAVHAASGQQAWRYRGSNAIVGLPTVAGSRVFFAQADGTVTALDLKSGAVQWQYLPPEDSYGAETIVDSAAFGDDKVFVVKGDGKLYALSAANGQTIWTYDAGLELRSAPAFAEGLVLLGDQKGIFSAISPKTGKRMWGGGAGGAVNTPVAENGFVYFSAWDGSVQSVQIKGVIPQWKANVGDPVTTPPALEGDRLFVGTGNGKVVALNRKNGQTLWSFETDGGSVLAQPLPISGLVFVGAGNGTLFVLDTATGAARYTFPTGGGINGSCAFMNGVLYLASSDGNLYSIF
ncbi:MAG: PQQ-binding-like beta-propeller repeat protein [Fretibacterium sp.]|nr:PQQ-binding-like beta-propeller repeat protein [Fretibacterium sp.]